MLDHLATRSSAISFPVGVGSQMTNWGGWGRTGGVEGGKIKSHPVIAPPDHRP
jgi:hypothetical protein